MLRSLLGVLRVVRAGPDGGATTFLFRGTLVLGDEGTGGCSFSFPFFDEEEVARGMVAKVSVHEL